MVRHVLEIDELSPPEIHKILEYSEQEYSKSLDGKGVALLFEKPSNRTRNSMEMAVVQLGAVSYTHLRAHET